MKNKLFKKRKKGLASITIVLLLGILSILTITSLFTYNSWRWEHLENSIRKDNYNNAVDGTALLQYTLLMRQRNVADSSLSIYDSYYSQFENMPTTVSISGVSTLDSCSVVDLPTEYNNLSIKTISATSQVRNFVTQKNCCTAGLVVSDELKTEELINTHSKIRCKNLNWPNLKNTDHALMVSQIIQ